MDWGVVVVRGKSICKCHAAKGAHLLSDEQGFTTVGMVLALLITLSLIFTAAQVYRLQVASSKTQNVADVSALAAENEVAEFMIVVRTCDAVVLSLSLTSLVATGLGIAVLCTPATAPASATLLQAGEKIAQARNQFAEKAAAGLNRLQRLLPFMAAANAASVAAANNEGASNYLALALLAPEEGEEIQVGSAQALSDISQSAQDSADEIQEAAKEAEEAAQEAQEAKERGFAHDCGLNPSYCMYERAATLAGMSGANNPLYNSVDAWSFAVALKRAQAYYPKRLAQEAPEGSSVAEQARSALRKNFYTYAVEQVKQGYVHETADSFDALFPHLPRNTAEMRATKLYTDPIYPITQEGEHQVMHAWAGCPKATNVTGFGSIEHMETGSFEKCEACEFAASSMGKVAAASTSIENGFEYHYEAVADAADDYVAARAKLDPVTSEVKNLTGSLFDQLKDALGEVANMRINARPPGSLGVVVLVADTGQEAPQSGFESSFVQATGTLGVRAAVSSATLVAEPAGEGGNVISSLLDGLANQGGVAVGAAGIVLDCWSGILGAYANGQQALSDTVESALNALPLASASGLGTWAAAALSDVIDAVGLTPANMDALKPVLVNSAHITLADDSAFSGRLLSIKQQAVANPLSSNDLFSSVVGAAEQGAIEDIQTADPIEIASVELFDGGPSFTIEIPLPSAVKETAVDVVSDIANQLRALYGQVTGVRVWE